MLRMDSISPLDGRYSPLLKGVGRCLGEGALIRRRLQVECRYLQKLCQTPKLGIRRLKPQEKRILEGLANPAQTDLSRIARMETEGGRGRPATKHDVKAVEYYLRDRLLKTSLKDMAQFVHFGLTSEDVNNIAYALMLTDALRAEILPALAAILKALDKLAVRYAASPLLARTHGQLAVPTTFGKEFRVFHARLLRQIRGLEAMRLCAKLNGAVGNYNALCAAFPEADWERFSREFVRSFGLEHSPLTTQIEPHDCQAELFDALRRANVILLGLCQDFWRYISEGLIVEKAVAGEIGSSTMPQKVNPIRFENAEGNLGLANALLGFFSSKLPISRLQRDLSDSTVLRNCGVAFGHCLVAYKSITGGLAGIFVHEAAALAELESHPEVIAEGIQTILRREGAQEPYEQLARLVRGRRISLNELHDFIGTLDVRPAVKRELKRLSPTNYLGLAKKLALQRGTCHAG